MLHYENFFFVFNLLPGFFIVIIIEFFTAVAKNNNEIK